MRTIGLLGGSFNPAHAGHRHISLQALKRLGLDEIWWLVSPQNPLKSSSELADYAVRLAHARVLAAHPHIRVLDIEARLGLTYSIDTLRALQARHPRVQFVWLMGADNLAHFHRWRAWRAIAAGVPIAILDRAPYGLKALHGKFALARRATRVFSRTALLQHACGVGWMYLSIPRHPLSATFLRKTLGRKAFLRHNPPIR